MSQINAGGLKQHIIGTPLPLGCQPEFLPTGQAPSALGAPNQATAAAEGSNCKRGARTGMTAGQMLAGNK